MTDAAVETVADLAEDFIRNTLAFHPVVAANLGLHEYDGKIADYRPASIARRVAYLKALAETVESTAAPPAGTTAAFDRALLLRSLRAEAFRWDAYQEHTRSPMLYNTAGNVTLYVKRNYAPLPDRIRALTRHLELIPDLLEAAVQNLRDGLGVPVLEVAIQQAHGHIRYLQEDLSSVLEKVGDSSLRASAGAARDMAIAAWSRYADHLRGRIAQPEGAFAIGRTLFEGLLRTGELVEEPVEQLQRLAETDLARNLATAHEVAGRLGMTVPEAFARMGDSHPSADRLILETADLLEDLRAFLIQHDVITIPSEVRCAVRPSPPFMRAFFAMMDTVGPFEERADESYYYVTPADADWTPEQQEDWLRRFNYPTLRDVSIHEAYPGHYVHLLHVRKSRSRLGKITRSMACTEGWAHYCEQMMVEAGYGAGDPLLHLAQLGEALLRDCRFLIAVGMHSGGMTVDEATDLIVRNAFFQAHPARREAVRGTFDPMFLNYTLGKLMWLKLRDDYQREQGSAFTLKRFHDEALAHGLAPVPLIRGVLLRDPAGPVLQRPG